MSKVIIIGAGAAGMMAAIAAASITFPSFKSLIVSV